MKVCFVCSEYPPAPHGGIGSVNQILGRALVARGHQVKVLGVYRAVPDQTHEYDNGVEVWREHRFAARFGWIGARIGVYSRIAAWAERGEIDLVEVPDWEGWSAGWSSLPIPVVIRLHGSSCYFAAELQQRYRQTTYLIERNALRRADFWCSVSRYTADRTRQLYSLDTSATVIYNPVDVPSCEDAAPRSRLDVVFSGTLTEKKGIVPLMQAWPSVCRELPGARLHVYGKDSTHAGKPSMMHSLQQRLPESARESVVFHGHTAREALLKHLRRARVAIFPSFAEAFAMAPLEAMAQGCPTIYSTRGSGPELIDHGRDGLLVDPAKPEQIASALRMVLEQDGLAARLGAAGREKVKGHFLTSRILESNEEFYQSCLERFHYKRSPENVRVNHHLHL